jgi:hypothetical protein
MGKLGLAADAEATLRHLADPSLKRLERAARSVEHRGAAAARRIMGPEFARTGRDVSSCRRLEFIEVVCPGWQHRSAGRQEN